MARDPEWGIYQDGVSEYKSYIFGAEFETAGSSMGSVHNYDVPCAVCLTQNRSVVKMFPGEVPTLNKINLIIINQPYRKKNDKNQNILLHVACTSTYFFLIDCKNSSYCTQWLISGGTQTQENPTNQLIKKERKREKNPEQTPPQNKSK